MDFHEFANIFPLMCEEEFNALVNDIQANGLQDKEIITFEGKISDGRNRYRACGKLGIKPYVFVEWKKNKDELLVYILSKNLHRRHLNESQRAMIAVRLKPLFEEKAKARQLAQLKQNRNETVLDNGHKRKEPIHSHKEAGKILNVSGKSVQRAEKVVNNGNPELIRAVEQGKITVSGAMKITDKPIDYQNSVIEKIENGKAKTVKEASRKINQEKRIQRKTFIPDEVKIKSHNFQLYCRDSTSCDFDFLKPGSVDFIITDPPYLKSYVHLFESLAKIGKKYLKEGGSLLTMVGHIHLQKIFNLMSSHLNYHWTISYLMPGKSSRIWQRNIFVCWKPILWFTKGEYKGGWRGDVVKSLDSDKRFHEWGQSESGMTQLIESFTCPGDVILDPFLGGGTTGIVAVRLHRKFIGIDIDKNAVAIATERFNNEFLDVAV